MRNDIRPKGERTLASLLVIDPGLSTGVAVFEGNTLLYSFTSRAPHRWLTSLLESEDEVVCEKGPRARRQPETCEPVEELVKGSGKPVHWVKPSQWKPSPTATLLDGDRPKTKHEKDAIRMGRWHLSRAV